MGSTNLTLWSRVCLAGLYIFSRDVMANLVQQSAKLKLLLHLKMPGISKNVCVFSNNTKELLSLEYNQHLRLYQSRIDQRNHFIEFMHET